MFTVVIRWLGWDVELERADHVKEMKKEGDAKAVEKVHIEQIGRLPKDEDKLGQKGSKKFTFHNRRYKFDRYALDKDGKAISLDSYCLKLAGHKSTYVILQQDMDPLGKVK